jgi:hypothetical protein
MSEPAQATMAFNSLELDQSLNVEINVVVVKSLAIRWSLKH